jgi:hypothetical protein
MPYIEPHRRAILGRSPAPADAGELNYAITKIIADYIKEHGLRYQRINDVLGALEGAKFEFYRRVVVPYEDTKIKGNGDVY